MERKKGEQNGGGGLYTRNKMNSWL
jgi:hypothetical protein